VSTMLTDSGWVLHRRCVTSRSQCDEMDGASRQARLARGFSSWQCAQARSLPGKRVAALQP